MFALKNGERIDRDQPFWPAMVRRRIAVFDLLRFRLRFGSHPLGRRLQCYQIRMLRLKFLKFRKQSVTFGV